MYKTAAAILSALFLVFLFLTPDLVTEGAKNGIILLTDILIPSLFPFMALIGFMSLSGILDIICVPLRLITGKLLHLPDKLGAVVIASIIGGFPSGARILSSLVDQSRLSREDAAAMLGCCINPGPAFVVIAVGKMMFNSVSVGWILLLSQLLSTFFIAGWIGRHTKFNRAAKTPHMTFSSALVKGVSDASSAMISIGGFVLLFAVISNIISSLFMFNQFIITVVSGILEVTNGCVAVSEIGGKSGVIIASFFVSFSGLSVCCQVMSLAINSGISAKNIIKTRLIAAVISSLLTAVFLIFDNTAISVFSGFNSPVATFSPNRLLSGVCICGIIIMTMTKVNLTGKSTEI